MPNQQLIEKSYTAGGGENDAFFVRTMKKDLERLRQGLPLREAAFSIVPGAPSGRDASRRLATTAEAHTPTERPPQEAAMTLPRPEMQGPATGSVLPDVSRVAPRSEEYQAPPILPRPTPMQAVSPYTRPIETMQPQARPAQPIAPRMGKMETEKMPATGQVLTLFQRIFPTRRRLFVVLCGALAVLATGTYALFAYFGKPLPGTHYVFSTQTPAPSASKTPSPSPTAPVIQTPTPAPTPTPTPSSLAIAHTPHLPISRLALVDLPQNATKLDLIGQLTSFANSSQSPGDFTQVIIRHEQTQTPLGASELFSFLGLPTPEGLFGELSQDITLFFYAPRDAKTLSVGHSAPAHFGVLIPIKGSADVLKEKLRTWEATLGGDISPLAFGREWMLGQNPLFESNFYQGTLIRYQNFPDPYVAADYAVFEGSDPPLLIITTSRESAFSVVGILNYRSE